MPLFLWSIYATSLIFVLGTPVLAITLLLIAAERLFHFGFFDPALGGDPVLFQHLFWFYSHPAVYIMVLPAMGVVSELMAAFCRKPVFGYSAVAFSSVAIAVLGFLVWGHHMFVAGESVYAALVFSVLSFLVAIPSAVKVFNWTATMYKGSISWETPMLYAMGFIGLFTIGGLTGLFLAAVGLDVHVHDTYFVIAHFHYIMVGGTLMGYLGGLHYWWPKISGRIYNEFLAKLSAGIIFLGFNLTFFPQFILGYLGMPRRYHAYPPEFQMLNVLSSAGASILGVGYLIPMVYLMWSLRYGRVAGANPWGAVGLEWTTTSPPPTENFEETPIVTWDAYAYTRAGGAPCRLTPSSHHPAALAHQFDDLEQQREVATLGMWVFLATESPVLRRPLHDLPRLPQLVPGALHGGKPRARHLGRHDQHGRPHHQQPDDGAGGAGRADGRASPADGLPGRHDGARVRVPRHQGLRVPHGVRRASRAGPRLPVRGEVLPARAALLLAVLRDDRPARGAHDHRPRASWRSCCGGRGRGIITDGVLQPDRSERPLLALRRHRLDLPASRCSI